MSPEVIIAGFTLLFGAFALLWGLHWSHTRECHKSQILNATTMAQILTRLERIDGDIGDHHTGMRGDLHNMGNDVFYQGLSLSLIADKLQVDLPPRGEIRRGRS